VILEKLKFKFAELIFFRVTRTCVAFVASRPETRTSARCASAESRKRNSKKEKSLNAFIADAEDVPVKTGLRPATG